MKPGSEILVSCADRIVWVRVEGNGSSTNSTALRDFAKEMICGVRSGRSLSLLLQASVVKLQKVQSLLVQIKTSRSGAFQKSAFLNCLSDSCRRHERVS